MKIEEGMYVRTDKGYIGRKILDNNSNDTDIDFEIGKIKKASFNIIDLIEEGDFVNGKVIEKYRGELGVFFIYENCWKFKKIKDYVKDNSYYLGIVTKEQFKNMEYEVK